MLTIAKQYTSFNAVESMNVIVRKFKEVIRGILPDSITKVVDFLSTHSCRIKGVSWAGYDYMAVHTELSVSTLKRVIKRLVELGFIQRVKVWIGGRQSSNIIVIQPNIDWHHVESELMKNVRVEIEEMPVESPEEIPQEMPFDTADDTLSKTRESNNDADFWDVPEYGSIESSLSLSKQKDIKEEFPYLFDCKGRFRPYNWLNCNE